MPGTSSSVSRLVHRATAELLGTAFLVAGVIGSGIAAQQLSPDDTGLQLLENSVATGAVLVAQIVGGVIGAVLANLMFDLDAVSISTHHRATGGHLLGEVVATLGLVVVVFGALRSRRIETVALAVGGYITAAYWFTSSTSFANPAVTIARTLSDTFAGIAPASMPAFVLMQLLGGALGTGAVLLLHAGVSEAVVLPGTTTPDTRRLMSEESP
jgi:glycerol uptake facilitator-like aquaporin